jgi:hypothetical protein
MKLIPSLAAVVALAALTACGSPSASSPAAAPPSPAHAAVAKAKAAPSPACKLTTTFDYIERDDDPGASVMADEIGNTDYSDCKSSLADFAATAGQASGECTTIALASSNPGYDVNEVPAPPLKDVIASAGPGCPEG